MSIKRNRPCRLLISDGGARVSIRLTMDNGTCRMKQIVSALVLLLLSASSLFPEADSIRIGALYNLTGGMEAIDLPGYKGAKLAVTFINDRGGLLDGRVVELLAIDTRTDRKDAIDAAEELVSKGLSAAMGYGDTDFVLAAAPVFQRSGIPFVTSGATDPNIPNIVGPGVFLTAFGDDDQAYAMADFARRALKVKSVILWTNGSTDFTRILAKFFKERFQKLGGHIVLEQYFDNQATDFSSYVDRVKSMRPSADAIFISAVPSDISRTVTPLRRAGLAIPILSGDGFDADIVHVLGTANLATNIYFTTHTYRGDSRPEVLEFMKEYRKQYGQDPENAFAALGFDAANLIASAIQRAKSAEPAAVTRSLAQTRGFKGVTGEISFSRSTHVPVKPVAVVKVEAGHYSVVESWTPKDHASGTLEAPGSRGSLATGQGTPFHKTPNILPGRAVPLEHLGAHSLHDLACLFHRSLRPMRSPISMLPFVEKKNKG